MLDNCLVTKQSVLETLLDTGALDNLKVSELKEIVASIEEVDNNTIIRVPENGVENVSDGFHTFKDLYYQRAILFATIVNTHKEISWKSYKHSDGNYCFNKNGEWFIVGIDTPAGPYTYHFEKRYWNLFKCEEYETAIEWDGHTSDDVFRLTSLYDEEYASFFEDKEDVSEENFIPFTCVYLDPNTNYAYALVNYRKEDDTIDWSVTEANRLKMSLVAGDKYRDMVSGRFFVYEKDGRITWLT